ncbi:MAG: PAS domain-containing protein [Spirochaetales bacterium]|nr:PAS domain-containing protein [Spirochaetales bacterium]
MIIELAQFLKDSPFPWWEWDIKNNRVVFNDLKATMLGYDPARFHGKGYGNFTDLLHREDYERTMDAMRVVLEGKADLYKIDYRILASDGKYKWYMDRGFVTETEEGRPVKMRGIVIDLGQENSFAQAAEILLDMIKTSPTKTRDGRNIPMYTVCSNCTKVKVPPDRWIPVSKGMLSALKGAPSHGLCPECFTRLYPQMAEYLDES